MIEENNSPLKQKGGFAKSSGSRGKGGRNVGGYNVNTSFAVKPAWKKPRSGGFIGAVASPKPTKPYTIDDKGKVKVEPLTSTTTAFGRKKGAFDTTGEKPTGTDINQFTNSPGGTNPTVITPGNRAVFWRYKKGNSPEFDGRFFVKVFSDDTFTKYIINN